MENVHLLVDSCCDLSPEQIESMNASDAPLTITIEREPKWFMRSVQLPSGIFFR